MIDPFAPNVHRLLVQMLHRWEGERLIVVSQPAHAWISGQLASAWGNPSIDVPAPSADVVLAAYLHDIAWLDWESNPTFNSSTGLPYAFNEIPTKEHLGIWSGAHAMTRQYGDLPSLLVSMHGTYLYRRFHDFDGDSDEDAAMARSFLAREEKRQRETMSRIERTSDADSQSLEIQRSLVSTWDAMSLAIIHGKSEPTSFETASGSGESASVEFIPDASCDDRYLVSPWPFRMNQVELRCHGRQINGPFSDVRAMRTALNVAPDVTLTFRLRRG